MHVNLKATVCIKIYLYFKGNTEFRNI